MSLLICVCSSDIELSREIPLYREKKQQRTAEKEVRTKLESISIVYLRTYLWSLGVEGMLLFIHVLKPQSLRVTMTASLCWCQKKAEEPGARRSHPESIDGDSVC